MVMHEAVPRELPFPNPCSNLNAMNMIQPKLNTSVALILMEEIQECAWHHHKCQLNFKMPWAISYKIQFLKDSTFPYTTKA